MLIFQFIELYETFTELCLHKKLSLITYINIYIYIYNRLWYVVDP